ncbi:hypothetical protein FCL53_10540 [Elizabethkingia meningoseptica]|uniref:hypothetical protein n=1 Tax=Elizabethkingia meningoseptica TaxID=238 RepID=UPI0013652B54|nr:hypothetical protein [Elizabethkingia meningoseptica]MVW92402.1 hypothetical protein [Elizabethkingia meningoseptica]
MIKIGECISDNLAGYLKEFTSTKDRSEVSYKAKVSPSILRDITYQYKPVVNTNIQALMILIDRAEQNADNNISKAKKFKGFIRKIKTAKAAN